MTAIRAIPFLVMRGLVVQSGDMADTCAGIPFFLVVEDGSDAMCVNG